MSASKAMEKLAALTGDETFARVKYTAESGEVAVHFVNLQVNLQAAYAQDIDALTLMVGQMDGIQAEAAAEILASLKKSLEVGIGNNPAYTCADTYTHPKNMPGIKMHKETGVVYVYGIVESKTVLTPGTYKAVNSAPKTVAKNIIRARLLTGKIRTLKIASIGKLTTFGKVVEIEDEPEA